MGNKSTTAIAVHPTMNYRLATGNDAGDVHLWDMRNLQSPESCNFRVHTSTIWEIQFAPNRPEQIWSCSEDGHLG